MPIKFESQAGGGTTTEMVFVGPVDHTIAILVNCALLTNKEIDRNGYTKPGIPLTKAGTLVTSGFVFGVTVGAIKVAKSNSSADIAAAGTVPLAVGTIGQVNQDIAEDNLERAYTSAEQAGFIAAGSKLVLL